MSRMIKFSCQLRLAEGYYSTMNEDQFQVGYCSEPLTSEQRVVKIGLPYRACVSLAWIKHGYHRVYEDIHGFGLQHGLGV